jgi:hypothetical protein
LGFHKKKLQKRQARSCRTKAALSEAVKNAGPMTSTSAPAATVIWVPGTFAFPLSEIDNDNPFIKEILRNGSEI